MFVDLKDRTKGNWIRLLAAQHSVSCWHPFVTSIVRSVTNFDQLSYKQEGEVLKNHLW